MNASSIRPLILSFALLLCFAPDRAKAKEESDRIIYRVVKGDNLYALAERYLLRAGDAAIVQRLNRITNPANEQVRLASTPTGLLTTLTDARQVGFPS